MRTQLRAPSTHTRHHWLMATTPPHPVDCAELSLEDACRSGDVLPRGWDQVANPVGALLPGRWPSPDGVTLTTTRPLQ